jgi:hypothetical protein
MTSAGALLLAALLGSERAGAARPPTTTRSASAPATLAEIKAALADGALERAERLASAALQGGASDPAIRLAAIDISLAQGRARLALEQTQAATKLLGDLPELHLRAAQAYYELGAVLGKPEIRTLPAARSGQFIDGLLVVEPRPGPDRFLCCGRESALFQLRLALDGGLDSTTAFVLHARIWQRLRRPEAAFSILRSREGELLAEGGDGLSVLSALALETDALADYLRYEQRRAQRAAPQRDDILSAAYLTAAERYNARGDEALYSEWLARAGQLQPRSAELRLRLGDALWSAGQRTAAAAHYRAVLDARPNHPQREHIAERLAGAQ